MSLMLIDTKIPQFKNDTSNENILNPKHINKNNKKIYLCLIFSTYWLADPVVN